MSETSMKHTQAIDSLKTAIVQQGSIASDLEFLKRELEGVLASDVGEGKGVFIAGPSGSGKTTLLSRFYQDVVKMKNCGATFSMTMPASPTPKDFCIALLRVIGHPYGNEKVLLATKESALKIQIEAQIKSKNIRVLIIDEFQQLTEKLGEKTMRSTADMLKNWISDFPLLMVFAGTNSIEQMLDSNEQMESRSELLSKRQMTLHCKSDYIDYVTFLHGLNEVAGFTKVKLYTPKIALCLFLASGGDLRKIRQAIIKAISEAMASDDKYVTETHFKVTWRSAARTFKDLRRLKGNPFNKRCGELEELLNISYDLNDLAFEEEAA